MATWVTPRVWVAGERVSASKMNEISTDLGILFPHTTAGDLAFRSAASTDLTRLANVAGGLLIGGATVPEFLAAGAAGTVLKGGTAPTFGALVHRRKGGSSTHWNSTGSSSYTPSTAYLQVGSVAVSVNTTGTANVTYPVAFTYNPLLICSARSAFGSIAVRAEGETTSGFDLAVQDLYTSGAITVDVSWLAIGVI